MTDLALLSKDVAAFLAPALPYLVTIKDKAIEGAATKLGESALESTRKLWARLRPKVEANLFAVEAAQQTAQAPADLDAQASFRLALRKLLEADPALAADLAKLWAETKTSHTTVTVTASGAGSVAIGGNVTGSNINTGNQNTGR